MFSKIINLSKDNVLVVSVDCGKPVEFYNNGMHFFNKSLIYSFQDPVKMKRSTYNMLLTEISSNDKLVLNLLFSRIDTSIVLKDNIFINCSEVKEDPNDGKYMIQVEIQGYKKQDNNISTCSTIKCPAPIWKIKSVKSV